MPNDLPDWTSIAVMTENAIPNSPFTFAKDGLLHNVNGLQLPLGCQWLVFGTKTATDIEGMTVTGNTTNIQYASNALLSVNALTYVRVHPAIDPTVNIQLQISSGAGNAIVGIAFGFAPTVSDLDTLVASPVFLSSDLGVILDVDVSGSGGGRRLGISETFAVPAPWQAAINSPFVVNATLAGGISSIIVPAVANAQVLLYALNRTYDAAVVTELAIQDTAGTNYHIEQASSVNPPPALFSGAPIPVGLGVQLKNLGVNAVTVRGSLVCSQK